MPRPTRPERFQLGKFYLSKKSSSPYWRISWLDEDRRQVTGFSTGTADFDEAKIALAKHFVTAAELKEEQPESVPIAMLLDRYYEARASKLPSKANAIAAIAKWKEYWKDATLAEMTRKGQEKFIEWFEGYASKRGKSVVKKLSRATVSTQLSVGYAAIHYAVANQELKSMPALIPYKHNSRRKRVLTIDEAARLLDAAADTEHMWRWCLLAFATAARPGAVLKIRPTPPMLDLEYGLIDLLPPEVEQEHNKRRPIVPIAPTLLPWLRLWTSREALIHETRRGTKIVHIDRLITFRGKHIKEIRMGFARLKARAGITDPTVVPVTIRHTMATWLIRQRVPPDQREIFLGHKLPGSDTTSGYVHLDPDFLSEAVRAVDSYLIELSKRVQRPLRAACVPVKKVE